MRSEKSERSEMVSQILFGEVFEILEVDEKWYMSGCCMIVTRGGSIGKCILKSPKNLSVNTKRGTCIGYGSV